MYARLLRTELGVVPVAGEIESNPPLTSGLPVCIYETPMPVPLQYVTAGANPIMVKKGIDKTMEFLVGKLKENAKPVQGRNDIKVNHKPCHRQCLSNASTQQQQQQELVVTVIAAGGGIWHEQQQKLLQGNG
jgi:hypothetical protein